ncbi:MAG: hypothetical protein HQL79_12500 [Magnetococcales bacterium]|nr:hypothetical protein [Magnetococcales bacterium]
MANSAGPQSGQGLFVITVLEFFIGFLFVSFIVLSAVVLMDPKRVGGGTQEEPGSVPEKKAKIADDQKLVAEKTMDSLAEHLSSKLDRTMKERDDRLGRLIIGLGHKMDVANEIRESQWSRLRNEIDGKLEGILQEAALQTTRAEGIKGSGKGEADSVRVAEAPSPVVSDAPLTPVAAPAGDKLAEGLATLTAPAVASETAPTAALQVASAQETPIQTLASLAPRLDVVSEANRPAAMPELVDGVTNPAPEGAQKKGYFIALGCFSRADNALDRGRLVRPHVPLVYKKTIQDGAMTCLFSGPLPSKSEAESLLQRVQSGTHISGFTIGSY